MSFKEKNIAVSLTNFTLILGYFLIRILQMLRSDTFTPANVFRLWTIVIVLATAVTVLAIILTQAGSAIIQSVKTGGDKPKINDLEDERDKLIDLQGTKATQFFSSIGVFFAMLTFALGQPPLVMFSLLIFFGMLSQIIGDIVRLVLYRRGF